MRACVVERLAAPGAPHDLDELAGALVARLLVLEHAEAGQFRRFRPRHDVHEQATVGQPLVRRRHLRGQRG